MYSKNRDHAGPFSGNISPLPLTSRGAPGTAGIMNIAASRASITMDVEVWVPSHCSEPWRRKVTAPVTAPMMTIG